LLSPYGRSDKYAPQAVKETRFFMNDDTHAQDARVSHSFADLGLSKPLLRALETEGYSQPTPVQTDAIPHVLAGKDLLASAQTGTGKTAAFVLPMLERLGEQARESELRILVLSPTRELASQTAERAEAYGRHLGLQYAVVVGGVPQKRQERALARGPSMLVATPGRLLDLMRQGVVSLDTVDMVVLDEADRMLDMGFLPDVRRILQGVPAERQTLLLSATMPEDVVRLADRTLRNPVRVEAARAEETEDIEQSICFLSRADKRATLQRCLSHDEVERAIVFTRTKRGANRLAEQLSRGGISTAAIHGNKSQSARERALDGFRRGRMPVLIATDVAARGIDFKDVSHVINYDLPDSAESYTHRIGRTARAGSSGKAISFCDHEERGRLFDIERGINHRIPVVSLSSGRAEPIDPDGPGANAAPAQPSRRRPGPRRSVGRSRRSGRARPGGR
jgi:ATP-dependent RNA helicase RhlE